MSNGTNGTPPNQNWRPVVVGVAFCLAVAVATAVTGKAECVAALFLLPIVLIVVD